MSTIRFANAEDVPALVALGRRMHAESRFRALDFDAEKVAQSLHALAQGAGCLFVAEQGGQVVGGFAGMAAEHWFSRDRVAQDLALFIAPEHRGGTAAARLVRAFEDWARRQGVVAVEIAVNTGVHPERTGELLQALGMTPVATLYSLEN